jgi:hypothetical protein
MICVGVVYCLLLHYWSDDQSGQRQSYYLGVMVPEPSLISTQTEQCTQHGTLVGTRIWCGRCIPVFPRPRVDEQWQFPVRK